MKNKLETIKANLRAGLYKDSEDAIAYLIGLAERTPPAGGAKCDMCEEESDVHFCTNCYGKVRPDKFIDLSKPTLGGEVKEYIQQLKEDLNGGPETPAPKKCEHDQETYWDGPVTASGAKWGANKHNFPSCPFCKPPEGGKKCECGCHAFGKNQHCCCRCDGPAAKVGNEELVDGDQLGNAIKIIEKQMRIIDDGKLFPTSIRIVLEALSQKDAEIARLKEDVSAEYQLSQHYLELRDSIATKYMRLEAELEESKKSELEALKKWADLKIPAERLAEELSLLRKVVEAARDCYENDDFVTDKTDKKQWQESQARDARLGDSLAALDSAERKDAK